MCIELYKQKLKPKMPTVEEVLNEIELKRGYALLSAPPPPLVFAARKPRETVVGGHVTTLFVKPWFPESIAAPIVTFDIEATGTMSGFLHRRIEFFIDFPVNKTDPFLLENALRIEFEALPVGTARYSPTVPWRLFDVSVGSQRMQGHRSRIMCLRAQFSQLANEERTQGDLLVNRTQFLRQGQSRIISLLGDQRFVRLSAQLFPQTPESVQLYPRPPKIPLTGTFTYQTGSVRQTSGRS
jgi:hypothetical protein